MTDPTPTLETRVLSLEQWRARVITSDPVTVLPPPVVTPPPVVAITPPPPVVVAAVGIFDDYSATVPHWKHIRIQQTDWRIQNIADAVMRATELAWMNAHIDLYMGGIQKNQAGIPEIEYGLYGTVMQPGQEKDSITSSYYPDMVAWFGRPENIAKYGADALERQFQHALNGQRIEFVIWGSKRWSRNPGAPGALDYEIDRVKRILIQEPGFVRRGVFSDELDGTNTMLPFVAPDGTARATKEFPTRAAWTLTFCELLKGLRAAIQGLIFEANISEYVDPAGDSAKIAIAAGFAHLEQLVNPQREPQFAAVDSLLKNGVTVQLVDAISPENYANGLLPVYTPGAEKTAQDRGRMFSLGYYYMVVTTPDKVYLTVDNPEVALHPSSACWIKAIEANMGAPTAARGVWRTVGDKVNTTPGPVYLRLFERGLWMFRGIPSWDWQHYDYDAIADVTLPPGTWLRLMADGTLTKVYGPTIQMRPAEAIGLFDATKLTLPQVTAT